MTPSCAPSVSPPLPVVVIGGGPAGLMAAQVLSEAGVCVHLYDAMPSVGRKFLLAGKGGLNLTHSDAAEVFAGRYGLRRAIMQDLLHDFDANALRAWALSLGIATFVGTSGRVFPTDMKAAPLLRAWLHRLRHPAAHPKQKENADATSTHQVQRQAQGVQFHMRHRWTGWGTPLCPNEATGQTLNFDTPQGAVQVQASAVVLALGGGSWARLGSDGAWVPLLAQRGVAMAPLLPSNCGFDVANGWSKHFADRFAGQPFKSVALQCTASDGQVFARKGEFIATATGVEGSLIYAASSLLRDEMIRHGKATFYLDLLPQMTTEKVLAEVCHPRGARSLSNHLKSRLHIDGIKAAILYEQLDKATIANPAQLAAAIKALPITVTATRPLDEAISTAGGVLFEALTKNLMLKPSPGVFCAGEMLDWEAPTGGYLLQASFASGRRAGHGVLEFLRQ